MKVTYNYEVTYRLSTSECMSSHSSKWRNINHIFLITHIVLECYPNMKVTYHLSTCECMSTHSSKWRKEQSFILNHTSCARISTNYEVTYGLSTSECMSSHSSKWRKYQPYHTSNSHECMRVNEEVLIAFYIQKAVFLLHCKNILGHIP